MSQLFLQGFKSVEALWNNKRLARTRRDEAHENTREVTSFAPSLKIHPESFWKEIHHPAAFNGFNTSSAGLQAAERNREGLIIHLLL